MVKTGILGAGAMGTGIAQVAATAGNEVILYDIDAKSLTRSEQKLDSIFTMLIEKGKLKAEEAIAIKARVKYTENLNDCRSCELVIESVIEEIDIKKSVLDKISKIISESSILATNTSSLSVTELASTVEHSQNFMGLHFFNPVALMPLVEVIPAFQTDREMIKKAIHIVRLWGKYTVIAKDTPGFIVNKVARPFYSEALRIYEEGLATPQEIDWVMTEKLGFRMGPFTLMDFIGHDVNYNVTFSVWQAFYGDPRYTPSMVQRKLIEAGMLGKKSEMGFFDYRNGARPEYTPPKEEIQIMISERILAMLINEAADTVYLGICSEEDVEIAMTKGVNYPKGLLQWGEVLGYSKVVDTLDQLFNYYHDMRYRASPWLRKKV